MEDFLSRADRRRYSLASHELERRWKAVRERMTAKGIDFLVVQSQQRYAGGYFRWFTDIPGANFPISAVFPLNDDMTIIAMTDFVSVIVKADEHHARSPARRGRKPSSGICA